jgi:hypothetical protein
MKTRLTLAILTLAAATAFAGSLTAPRISGDYLEVRSCDVYTGPCFANAEMGLDGKEGMLVWSIREGTWNGVALNGLSVVAVIRTDGTLGNMKYEPRAGKAVLIVDAKADSQQEGALKDFATTMAGKLIRDVAAVRVASMDVQMGHCKSGSCAKIKAGNLVQISTRCFGDNDHVCGNEDRFYPPLLSVDGAVPAFTELAAFTGRELDMTWQMTDKRSAYLGTFAK